MKKVRIAFFMTYIKAVFLFTLLIGSLSINAQNRNSIWCFGDSAGIDFRNLNNPLPINSGMDGRGSCPSISDSAGNLQFYAYSFGPLALTKIMTATHTLMPNCTLLQGWDYYSDNVIIPKPGSSHEFYDFYLGSGGHIDTTYYALVDLNLNGGLGDVVQKNVPIAAYRGADCLTAVKHGNGRDWWIIGKMYANPVTIINRFLVFLVTQDSVYSPIIQDLGGAKDVGFQKIIWHPSKDKFMNINSTGLMAEYDFDRCTGTVSLNRTIFAQQFSNYTRLFVGGAYSPNGNVFYVDYNTFGGSGGDYNYLLQFDLNSPDIAAMCDTLDSTLYPPVDCGMLRLAPNGKIYYSQAYISSTSMSFPYADSMYDYINQNLGVINYPDSLGAACNFQPFSFYLGGKRTYYGLPNNPDYELGPVVGSVCDSLFNRVNEIEKPFVRIFPNPASDVIRFGGNLSFKNSQVRIYNPAGVLLKSMQFPDGNSFLISTEDLIDGIYFCVIIKENEIIATEKLVVLKSR